MLNKYKFKKIFIACLLSAVFILNFITGCSGGGGTSATEKVADKLELAVKYLTENKFEEAVLAYQEVIKIDKYALQAYQGLARVYTVQGKFEDAQEIYQQGLEVLKDNALLVLRLNKAGMYVDKNDLEQAEQVYKQLINEYPGCIEAYQGLALLYQQKGDTQQSQAVLGQAIQSNPDNYLAYNALAGHYIFNGQKEKALDALVKSITLNMNQADAYTILDNLYDGRWDGLVQESGRVAGPNVAAMLKLYALYQGGLYEKAITVYQEQLSDQADNHKAGVLAAMAMFQAGDKDSALKLIEQLSSGKPNEWIMADIASYYLIAGETDKAIEWAFRSFETNSQNFEAVKVLYGIYSKDDDPLAKTYLAKVYLAKLVMYSWQPLSVMEQELVANSLEMPFNIDRKSSENDSDRPEAANGTYTEIDKMILKVIYDSQDLLEFRQSCQERPALAARNKNDVYLDNDRNVAYWSVLISEHGVNMGNSLAFETANGTVLWKPSNQHAFKPLLFRIHKPRIYSPEEVRAQQPTWKALDNYTGFVKADYDYEEVSYEMEFMTVIAKGKPLEEHLKDAGYDLKDFIIIDINEKES